MVELKDTFTSVGCPGARTYIQSGNVVFDVAADLVERVPELVTQAMNHRFGVSTDVIVRSSEELRQVAASSPFDTSGDPRLLHVAFLENTPSAEAVAQLDPERSPQNAFRRTRAQCLLALPQRRGRKQADERVSRREAANREHDAELADRPRAAGDG